MSDSIDSIFQIYCELIEKFSPCMNDYLYIIDFANDQYFISPSACSRFALPGNCFPKVTETHRMFVYPDDYAMLIEDIQQIMSGKRDEHNLKYRWIGLDQSPIWINCRGRVIKDQEGNVQYMIGCINEIGNKQLADNISGLLGEIAFIDDVKEIPTFSKGFVLRIGIDDFKRINEKNGIHYGDKVLQQVAKFITQCITPQQMVYRIVADEFLITDFTGGSFEDAKELYLRIRDKVDDALDELHYEVLYTISGGILMSSDLPIDNYEELLKLSQFALSIAKFKGKNQYYHFRMEDYKEFLRKRELEKIFRNSVSQDFKGFSLNYQPIVKVQSGRPIAAEALLRFTTENGENISPMEMIPCLEDTGLIIPVGKWIMRTALSACKEFNKFNPDFMVTINLSYVQLLKSGVSEDIKEYLDAFDVKGSNLTVELTESGYLEKNVNVLSIWKKLKSIGVRIAIDDFGTGYSNFSNIGDLQPDFVKIDRQFTFKAFKNEFDFLLLENIIKMTHNMNLKFVVEGIEKQEEVDKIMKFQPDCIQGYFYGRPYDKDTFISKVLV